MNQAIRKESKSMKNLKIKSMINGKYKEQTVMAKFSKRNAIILIEVGGLRVELVKCRVR